MKPTNLFFALALLLCGVLILTSCGGSSTGPDDNGGNGTDDPPSTPTNVTGSSGDQVVQLNWEANDENDLDGYNLYRSTSSISDISDMDPINGSDLLENTTYDDTDVDNGTTYYYRITAVDEGSNESNSSSEVEVTPFSNPPDRP